MRVIELYVSAFGGLRDLRLGLTEGLNTVYRPNGWGKTTLAEFLKAMLYGLSPVRGARAEDNERKKYTPWQGGVFGGSMSFESAKGSFRVERFFGARESADTFALYDLATNLESNAYSENLGEELFGIDADGFARTVCLSRRTALPKRESASISARLASLVEAADDVGDYDAAAAMLEKRSRQYLTTGNRGQIPTLEEELISLERAREELLREREMLKTRKRELAALKREIETTEAEAGSTRAALHEAARSQERAVLRTQREALAARVSRLSSRVRALDAEAGGKQPSDALIRHARECWEAHRLAVAEAERPVPDVHRSRNGIFVLTLILLLSALALLVVATVLSLLPLAILSVGLFVAGTVTAIFWGRGQMLRIREKREAERLIASRQELLHTAKAALADALADIGAPPHADGAVIEAIAQRRVEYRLLRAELREAREALESFDAAHPTQTEGDFCAGDTHALAAREQKLAGRLSALRAKYAELVAAIERLCARTESIPDTERQIIDVREALREAREAHETLLQTQKYLRMAKESLSVRYLDRMQKSLSAYLGALSPHAPTPVADVTLALSVRTDTGTHRVSELSSGWQDLIDFCARLALSDALFDGAESPLLILDDPFVNLDDAHLHAAKMMLARLATRYQILYTVCQKDRG